MLLLAAVRFPFLIHARVIVYGRSKLVVVNNYVSVSEVRAQHQRCLGCRCIRSAGRRRKWTHSRNVRGEETSLFRTSSAGTCFYFVYHLANTA